MRTFYKIFLGVVFLGLLWFLGLAPQVSAGTCQVNINFNVSPNPAPFNQNVTLAGTVTVSGFEPPGTANAGFCMYSGSGALSGNYPLKRMVVSFSGSGIDQRALSQPIYIDLTAGQSAPYTFSTTVKPSDFSMQAGQNFSVRASVCPAGTSGSGPTCSQYLTRSGTVTVNLTAGVYGTFACIDSGGINRCSPGIKSDCSDVSACTAQQKQACRSIPDTSQCGRPAASTQTHKACMNNACVNVSGPGPDTCTTSPDSCAGGGGGGPQSFVIPNPIGVDNFQDLVNIIGRWIFNLAIPIAVAIIIYAGVLMLTSGGEPKRFQKGTEALKWAVIGLAVVLIGKGFVSLIQSILSLRE